MQAYDRRFEDVLDAAERIFARQGFHAASMRDLARAARMSIAGLYYYLPSKQLALYLVCKRIFDRLEAEAQSLQSIDDPAERLRAFIGKHLHYMIHDESAYRVLLHEMEALEGDLHARIRARRRHYFTVASGIVRRLGANQTRVSARVAAGALFGMMNWAPTWYRCERDGEIGSLADTMMTLFLEGFIGSRLPQEIFG